MPRRFIYVLLSLFALFQPANAGSVIVELFTSQGCSSCPPADELLRELSKDPDIIPLAYHVTYWNYIGWTDTFASKKYDLRQKSYAFRALTKRILTPQFIINGKDIIDGTQTMKITQRIAAHKRNLEIIELDLVESGNLLAIQAETEKAFQRPLTVLMLEVYPPSEVAIKRGENRGKNFIYTNVVKKIHTLGQWSGKDLFRLQLEKPKDVSVVVMIQEPDFGPILAARTLASR